MADLLRRRQDEIARIVVARWLIGCWRRWLSPGDRWVWLSRALSGSQPQASLSSSSSPHFASESSLNDPATSLSPFSTAFYLVIVSPILYDFYNYGPEDRQLSLLLTEFLQSVAFLGALLFFIGMKNSTMTSSKQNQRSQA
ncbi:hypothetical protein Bca52824_043225 [Brassica carinata]|uniref:Uncharacterized protein n=1 Tax=Brassica carinata TaxID=52824 RepID=A0A8X7V1T6_BRACI|nr:hypothetical protein Bca52824_043225 [Brassica carinata]